MDGCVGTNFSIISRHQHIRFAYVFKFEGNYREAANCNKNTDKFPVLDHFLFFSQNICTHLETTKKMDARPFLDFYKMLSLGRF